VDIYFIDMNGGAATLIVTPAGENVLIDSGMAIERDAGRIEHLLKDVVSRPVVDHMITTHWHLDHYGAIGLLDGRIEFRKFYDKGIPDSLEEDPKNFPRLIAEYRRVAKGKRCEVKAGDEIEVKQAGDRKVNLKCLMVNAVPMSAPNAKPNPLCGEHESKGLTIEDNARSIAVLLSYGDFQFCMPADLTWEVENELVCPVNRVGQIELIQVSHHGLDISSNPVMVHAVRPKVAVMCNGPTKGGAPNVLETYRTSPGIADIWQLHRNWKMSEEKNLPANRTANWDNRDGGEFIKVRVASDGKQFAVQVGRSGEPVIYESWN
jgi:hypothetical protein